MQRGRHEPRAGHRADPCELREPARADGSPVLQPKVALYRYGDVRARMRVRLDEIHESIRLIREVRRGLPLGRLVTRPMVVLIAIGCTTPSAPPEVPANLRDRPTLVTELHSQRAGSQGQRRPGLSACRYKQRGRHQARTDSSPVRSHATLSRHSHEQHDGFPVLGPVSVPRGRTGLLRWGVAKW